MRNNGEDVHQGHLVHEMAEWLPKNGDRLFVPSDNGANLDPLCVTKSGKERSQVGRWELYADGFLQAADGLVDGTPGYQDALIYPILNLYRHHLELELKHVIRCCAGEREVLDQLSGKDLHSLSSLWHKMVEVYPRFGTWASPECTQACYDLVSEFDRHDPNSQASRYPLDRQERQTLLKLENVDLTIFKQGVHKISHYLSTVIEQLGSDRDWEEEMNSW